MAIGRDGTVLTCCADWMWETKVGDLKYQSVSEVWNGDGLHNFKTQISEGRQSENKACKGCTYYLVNTFSTLEISIEPRLFYLIFSYSTVVNSRFNLTSWIYAANLH